MKIVEQIRNKATAALAIGIAATVAIATPSGAQTTFMFGGYVKFDALATDFNNGSVPNTSVLRDVHFPGAIPVGGTNEVFATLDYHVKESRFNLATLTALPNGKSVRAFFEMDFLMAGQGDERVSNSFNPRLRHAYFQYGNWTFGQTWSTFMILDLVEDLDFAGAAEGVVFNRQPQVRFTKGPFQASIETSETTLTPFGESGRLDSGNALSPDFAVRYNMRKDWGNLSAAGILRRLNHEFADGAGVIRNQATNGVGATVGGRLLVGSRDDVRFQGTVGTGLGRYLALNFINGAQIRPDDTIDPIPSVNGFIGYRHWWNAQWRSNANYSFFEADYDTSITQGGANQSAWSVSVNAIYSPVPTLDFGVELMHAVRALEDGTDGNFQRLQFSAKYAFTFSAQTPRDQ